MTMEPQPGWDTGGANLIAVGLLYLMLFAGIAVGIVQSL